MLLSSTRIVPHDCLLLGTFVDTLQHEVHLRSQHVYVLDGVHAPLAWLEAIVALALVGDHLLDQLLCSRYGQREESSTCSSVNMVAG